MSSAQDFGKHTGEHVPGPQELTCLIADPTKPVGAANNRRTNEKTHRCSFQDQR